jgi:predicted RNA binding protein YcfA (HicA-like mRNA interferase family)
MSRLPVLNYRKVIAALERGGFYLARSTGGHDHFRHPDRPGILVTVPKHRGDLKRAVLRSILAQAGLTLDEFQKLI